MVILVFVFLPNSASKAEDLNKIKTTDINGLTTTITRYKSNFENGRKL